MPSFELKPVQFQEAWELSWHTTLGTFQPNETGGADFGGGAGAAPGGVAAP